MKEEDFDHLVGLIYESALDPALWQETMRSLANQVEADTFHLLGWNNQKQAVTLGVVDASWNDGVDLYDRYYGSIDPRRELASQSGQGANNQRALRRMCMRHAAQCALLIAPYRAASPLEDEISGEAQK